MEHEILIDAEREAFVLSKLGKRRRGRAGRRQGLFRQDGQSGFQHLAGNRLVKIRRRQHMDDIDLDAFESGSERGVNGRYPPAAG